MMAYVYTAGYLLAAAGVILFLVAYTFAAINVFYAWVQSEKADLHMYYLAWGPLLYLIGRLLMSFADKFAG